MLWIIFLIYLKAVSALSEQRKNIILNNVWYYLDPEFEILLCNIGVFYALYFLWYKLSMEVYLCSSIIWIICGSVCLAAGITPMGLLPDTDNCGMRMRRECRECFPRHRLQRKPLVSDLGIHHGTCVTHVPWCMSGSPTCGGGESVPGIPSACANRNFLYLARGPWKYYSICIQPWAVCLLAIVFCLHWEQCINLCWTNSDINIKIQTTWFTICTQLCLVLCCHYIIVLMHSYD